MRHARQRPSASRSIIRLGPLQFGHVSATFLRAEGSTQTDRQTDRQTAQEAQTECRIDGTRASQTVNRYRLPQLQLRLQTRVDPVGPAAPRVQLFTI
jgi:hypothetical protein